MSEMKDVREVAFQQWWRSSKYCQVVFPKDGWEQIARDGFNAAWNRRVTLEPAPKPAGGEPLKWVNGEARSPLGDLYTVVSLGGSVWQVRLNDTPFTGWHNSAESAMSEAQEHCEGRSMIAAAPPAPAASPSGGEVVVKALEWRRGYCDDQVIIEQASFGGLYQVRQFDGDIWLDHPSASSSKHETVGAAKAAAQADFEQRIRSALTSPEAPQASEVVRALQLHVAYEALPADRGGKNGPKGQAWQAFIAARDAALATYKRSTTDGQS